MGGTAANRDLKIELNQFALAAEFPRLDLDDRLGPEVVEALARTHAAVVTRRPELAADFPLPDSPEEVAAQCEQIVAWLRTSAVEALTVGHASA